MFISPRLFLSLLRIKCFDYELLWLNNNNIPLYGNDYKALPHTPLIL